MVQERQNENDLNKTKKQSPIFKYFNFMYNLFKIKKDHFSN